MKVEELMNLPVSLYRRVHENRSMKTITLDTWIHTVSVKSKTCVEDIRRVNVTDPDGAKAMKEMNLPCVTISGVFENERKTNDVTVKNPIICIDIDEKPDDMTWDDVKNRVFELPYVFYTSLSARGNGIFALVYFNVCNTLIGTFKALEKDFKEMGITIDRACKDITRLRFCSYDRCPLEKEDVEIYNNVIEEVYEHKVHKIEPLDVTFTYLVIDYLISHGILKADTYDEWFVEGCRLATFGRPGEILFEKLSNSSANFTGMSDVKHKWRECVKVTRMIPDCLYHYYRIAKDYLGPDWRETIEKEYKRDS